MYYELRKRGTSERARRIPVAGMASVVAGLLIWELVSRLLVDSALFLAAPTQILSAIVALARSGELWRHVGISSAEFARDFKCGKDEVRIVGARGRAIELAKD